MVMSYSLRAQQLLHIIFNVGHGTQTKFLVQDGQQVRRQEAGAVGPVTMLVTPRESRVNRITIAFCSNQRAPATAAGRSRRSPVSLPA